MTDITNSMHRPPAPARSGMTREQGKALGIATLGGAFEFYEFIIFIYLAPMISHHFFPADMPGWLAEVQTLGIFAAGYLVRPIGGIVLATIGDFIGRKRMFAFTLALLAVPTIAIGPEPYSCSRPTDDTTGGTAKGSRIRMFISASSRGKW